MKKLKQILLTVAAIAPMLFIACDPNEVTAPGYFRYLMNQIKAGALGDEAIIYMDSLNAVEWMAGGALRPIPEMVPSDMDTRLLPYFQRQGKTYAIPHNCHTIAMVVNRKLLDRAGAKVPTTWDELENAAAAVKKIGGNPYGAGLTPGFWNYVPFLYQAGGSLFDPSSGAVVLGSQAATQAMTFYSGLYRKDLIYPGGSKFAGGSPYWGTHDELLDAFAKERVAILFLSPGMYDELLQRMKLLPSSPGPVEVHDLPAGPKGKATIGMVIGFAVLAKSDKPLSEATRLFLQYITGPEATSLWIGEENDLSYVPARKSSQTQWLGKHKPAAAFLNGIEYLQPKMPLPVTHAGGFEFETTADTHMMNAMLGKLTPEQAVGELDRTAKSILDKYRVK